MEDAPPIGPHVGVFHFNSDGNLGLWVARALEAFHQHISVERVAVDGTRLFHPNDFDWAILVVTEASLSHPMIDRIPLFLSGSVSRHGVVVVTDHAPRIDFKPPPALLVNLATWKGSFNSKLILDICRLVTAPLPLGRDGPATGSDEDPLERALAQGSQDRIDKAVAANILIRSPDGELSLNPALFLRVEDLPFNPKAARILFFDNIAHLGDAIQRYRDEWRALPDMDDQTLENLRTVFGAYGLPMGADIPGWPPDDFEGHVRRAEAALRTAGMRQVPLGATFEAGSDFLVINPAGDDSDHQAAEKPAFGQMHGEIIRKARQFGSVAPRLDNQVGWQGISGLCDRLITLIDRPTEAIPDVVGSLYSAALELGSFFEMDRLIRRGEDSFAAPLDAEVRRPLEDLIRSLAPWLRNLPTIREMDDEAGQFLAPPALLEPSAEVIETAGRIQLISEGDAELLRGLLEAARRGEFQGAKAGHRGVLSARNMVVATVGLIGTLILSDFGAKSVLVGKAGTFLAGAEAAIVELVADLPHDLRFAIETIAREAREGPILPPAEPRPVRIERSGPRRRGGRDDERDDVGGTLINVSGVWHVRYEGGNGALVPLIGATFPTDVLDGSRTYQVFGRLLMSSGRPSGFGADKIVISASGVP